MQTEMKTFIYFSQGEWRTFQAEELPVKPVLLVHNAYGERRYKCDLKDYESEIAALKAESLKVGNPELMYEVVNSNLDREITLPCTDLNGEEVFLWPGTVEIKEHTPLGCETWADMEFVAILLNR